MASIDNELFSTDETLGEWWTWGQQFGRAISQASTRIGLGILSAGSGVTGAFLFQSPRGADYAGYALGAAGLFAAWFAGSVIVSAARGR